ncbi:12650_t:CDS:2, partial [Cetraspora pellucida]
KAQIKVIERDILSSFNIINTKVCLNEKNGKEEDDEKLIEELVKTFEHFDQATETFSADRYPTLSVVYPIIELLKSKFVADPNLPLTDDDLNEKYNNNSEDEKEDYAQSTFDMQLTIAQVKKAIYDSLLKY